MQFKEKAHKGMQNKTANKNWLLPVVQEQPGKLALFLVFNPWNSFLYVSKTALCNVCKGIENVNFIWNLELDKIVLYFIWLFIKTWYLLYISSVDFTIIFLLSEVIFSNHRKIFFKF